MKPRLPLLLLALAAAFSAAPTRTLDAQISPGGVQSYSNFNGGRNAIRAIDGSGLIDLGGGLFGHTDAPEPNMWLSANGQTAGAITFDLGDHYTVDTLRVWNYNESIGGTRPDLLNRGVATGNISVASDPAGPFAPVLSDAAFTIAPGTLDVDFSQVFDLAGMAARFVRIDILTNHGDTFTGLSEVQFGGTFVSAGSNDLAVSGVSASSTIDAPFDRRPEYTIGGVGLFGDAFHTIAPEPAMWLGAVGDVAPVITYDLGAVRPIGIMRVWNYNENANPACCLSRGIAQADILVSDDGLDFTPLIDNRAFAVAPGLPDVDFSEDVPINAQTRFIRIAVDSNHGDASFTGLSEVQFFAPTADSDGDNLPDIFEEGAVGNLTDLDGTRNGPGPGAGTGDFDGDALTDLNEYLLATNPSDSDTDDDLLPDGAEVAGAGERPATNPKAADTDGDTLSDLAETNTGVFLSISDTGTNPTAADTDGDGVGDADEIADPFTDPNDPDDFPPVPMVGYWPFDADLDPQPDLSGNANDAAVNGAAVWALDGDRASGVMQFSGGTGLLAPHSESLSIAGAITVAAWIKPSQASDWDGILAKNPFDGSGLNHAGNYELRVHTANRNLEFLWETGTPNSTTAVGNPGNPVADNVWTHIAFSGSPGAGYTFYLNGVAAGRGTMPDNFLGQNTSPLYIGNRADAFTPFDGCLDDVALFAGVLGPRQIEEIRDGNFSRYGLGSQPFAITSVAYDPAAPSVTLTFTSRPGKFYAVDVSNSLLPSGQPGGWSELVDSVPSQGSSTSFTDTFVAGSGPNLYYRVRDPAEQPSP